MLEGRPSSAIVFTLGVYDAIAQLGPEVDYPAEARERVIAVWQAMVDSVRLAYERGVPFAVGSDCGGRVHPHGRYARKISILVRACGLPAEHAIRAATRHAAAAAGHADRRNHRGGKAGRPRRG